MIIIRYLPFSEIRTLARHLVSKTELLSHGTAWLRWKHPVAMVEDVLSAPPRAVPGSLHAALLLLLSVRMCLSERRRIQGCVVSLVLFGRPELVVCIVQSVQQAEHAVTLVESRVRRNRKPVNDGQHGRRSRGGGRGDASPWNLSGGSSPLKFEFYFVPVVLNECFSHMLMMY